MPLSLLRNRVHRVVDILESPNALRRIYEEHLKQGYDVSLLPGTVIVHFPDGQLHFAWQDGAIREMAYRIQAQVS